ncbi:MAG TPA: cell division protein ZapA [Dissulfurispiraceae bacterium]|nr:cell division protein ZapA [Dissulfurispiraceae bacterium]
MESIEVTILGQNYLLKGDVSREYMKQLSEFVDYKIREVFRRSPGTTPLKASILTALMLADELHRIKKDHASVKQSIEKIESGAESLLNLID